MMDGHRPDVCCSDRYAAQQGHVDAHQACLVHLARDVAYAVQNSEDFLPMRLSSIIQRPTRENTIFAFVIVDTQRLQNVTWQQLSDYLTLVTLARPSTSAQDPDSIHSVFAARDAGAKGPPGLTAIDLSVLHGLYRSDPSLDPSMQRSQIANQVRRPEP